MLVSELRDRRYSGGAGQPSIELPAGDVTEGIIRIGDTVRRPHQPQSYAVAAYLDHLQRVGFDASPRFLGLDNEGRDVLTFLPGDVAGSDVEPRFRGDDLLASVARLVLRLHVASEGYVPIEEAFPTRPGAPEDWELVSHMDVTPQNVTVVGEHAIGLIDFDLARPTTRLLDSYNTAMHWVPILAPENLPDGVEPGDVLRRLRVFADAIGWSDAERAGLPQFGAEAADRSWLRMKERAEQQGGGWARMWADGVGEVIRSRSAWLRTDESLIADALRR